METHKNASAGLVFAAFAAIYLIWGSTYFAIWVGLKTLPPFLLSGLRFGLAGAVLLGWRLASGERPALRDLAFHALVGTVMLGLGTGAVVWSEQYISSGLAAIVVASMPFWFVALDRRQWAVNFANWVIPAGVAIGFLGILMLFGAKNALPGAAQTLAMLVLIGGCISWAGGSLTLKYRPTPTSPLLNAGTQMLGAGIFSLLVSGFAGEWPGFSFASVSLESWLGLAYLIAFGSWLGYLSYVWLLGIRSPVQVGTYAYVNPVVAVFFGWVFAGEPFEARQVLALAVILSGVLLINLPKYKFLKMSGV
ncbi:MAG: EamA family transporter [Saprospiraceae bacterium]